MNYPNLDCQLYFLFRTSLWRDGKLLEEPFQGRFDSIETTGIAIDEDKRLFRRSFLHEPKWAQYLADGWRDILQQYSHAFAANHPRDAETQARQFCDMALYGVAILIMDEQISRHPVEMPLRLGDSSSAIYQKEAGEDFYLRFVLPNNPTALFSLQDTDNEMPEIARCYTFGLESRPTSDNYALKFTSDNFQPYLVPMQPQPTATNAILAVYAMQHSNGLSATGQVLHWVHPFSNFLCAPETVGQPALFVSILSRLIVRQWQFGRMDCAAKAQRHSLQQANTVYRSQSEQYLVCTKNSLLEQQLREIEQLRTQAQYIKGRLQQAERTLSINRNNLEQRLQDTEHETRWLVTWQFGQRRPLLDNFDYNINSLHDHNAYLEGEVTFLTGARQRWLSYLEERRMKMSERLSLLGHVLVVLVIVAEIGNVMTRQTPPFEMEHWWDALWYILTLPFTHAGAYFLTVVAALLWWFQPSIKNFREERRACRRMNEK